MWSFNVFSILFYGTTGPVLPKLGYNPCIAANICCGVALRCAYVDPNGIAGAFGNVL